MFIIEDRWIAILPRIKGDASNLNMCLDTYLNYNEILWSHRGLYDEEYGVYIKFNDTNSEILFHLRYGG